MTRLQRLEQKLAGLKQKRAAYIRQCRLLDAQNISSDIEQTEKEIEAAKEYEAKPIRELLSSEQIEKDCLVPLMLEAHLAADFLADCCFCIEQVFKKHGLHAINILPDIKDILKRSNLFASILCDKNDALSNLLIDDEDLIHDIHLIYLRYIKTRLE